MAKEKQALLKTPEDIHETKSGQHVHLFFDNGDEYVGYFKEIDDDQIILQALKSKSQIGLPLDRLTGLWWEVV